MTSIERQGFCEYSGVQRPRYNILSYTWGRWENREDPTAPALGVHGTTWRIPPVKAEHFTVSAFQGVVNRLLEDGCEWAWVDVACIDQERDEIKAEEVGRQASIFKKAAHAYVWLSHLPFHRYKTITQTLIEDCHLLGNFSNEWFAVNEHPLESVERAVERSYRACQLILEDPWFSSLWTLQEYFLRNDVDAFSAEGEVLKGCSWMRLRGFLGSMYADLGYIVDIRRQQDFSHVAFPSPQLVDRAVEGRRLLARSGFQYAPWTSNANIQYTTARFRTTSRPEDRIYAIMQIYNLRVGQSARPNDRPSLDRLSLEFSAALNADQPLLAQMFNHESKADPDQSWRISESCYIPEFLFNYTDPQPSCTLRYNGTNLVATGKILPLSGLATAIESALEVHTTAQCFAFSTDAGVLPPMTEAEQPLGSRRLDASGILLAHKYEGPVGGDVARRLYYYYCWQSEFRRLTDQFSAENLAVLLLGSVESAGPLNLDARQVLGLVIRRRATRSANDGGVPSFFRVGICLWSFNHIVEAVEKCDWVTQEIKLL